MKLNKGLFFVVLSLLVASCATNKNKTTELPDLSEVTSVPERGDTSFESNETSPADLDTLAQTQQPVQAAPPAQIPAPVFEPPPAANLTPVTAPATITGLDYDANENGGTVIVRTNNEVTYTIRRNDKNHQYIIEFANTSVPKKFQRALVTKEFPGIMSSVQAYQSHGGDNTARLVLQMKGPMDPSSEPSVHQIGNVIKISTAGGVPSQSTANLSPTSSPNSNAVASTKPVVEDDQMDEANPVSVSASDSPSGLANDPRILNTHALSDFLNGRTKFYGAPISIEVNNQDIREVFKFISDESGINIILDDDIKGRVTMKLRKVPWDQALAIILQSNQFGYVRSGSILRIATLSKLNSEASAANNLIESQKSLQPLRTELFPLSYLKPEDVTAAIAPVLGGGKGKSAVDKRTHTLIVTDIPENLAKVKALLRKIDIQTPQVLIEAKIAEVSSNFSKSFGINWGTGNVTNPITAGSSGGVATSGLGTTNLLPAVGGPGGQSVDAYSQFGSSYNGSSANTLVLGVSGINLLGSITATLQMAEQNNMGKILSSPRIMALDRVEASITQTVEIPYSISTITGTSIQTSTSYKDVKLELKVTPQITADGGVMLDFSLQRDIAQQAPSGQAPGIDSRNAKTQVLVDNGDTVMVGGIYQSDTTNIESGIPVLKDLPLLGALFRYRGHNTQKNELVLFMTPRILNSEKAFVKGGEM